MEPKRKHPMETLKNKLSEILPIIPSGSKIYYLDYPVHGNIGDLLILKGTERFFMDYTIKVKARYSYHNFPDNLSIPTDHIIVCHGGGNFGDLYLPHQRFREKVVQRYPRNRIVILPQTIYFGHKDNEKKARNLFTKHQDLHIFVRDYKSFNRLDGFTNNTYLMPDMAHQLWSITSNSSPRKKNLFLLRRDKEKKSTLHPESNQDVVDWGTLLTEEDQNLIKKMILRHNSSLSINDPTLAQSWSLLKEKFIERAISLFSQYNEITTSRLHGHILACLMNKRNTLLDNSYGKNSAYYKTWTCMIESATFYNKKT